MVRNILLLCILFFSTAVFSQTDFTEADFRAKSVPRIYTKSHKKLTKHLTDGLKTDEEKTRAIYMWITDNIKYDVYSLARFKNKSRKPDQILKQKKALCTGYVDLFDAMCKEAGIKAFPVSGYSKNILHEAGDILVREDHVWNAVYFNNEWHLIDVTWGSGGIIPRKQIIRKILFNKLHIPYIKKYRYIKNRNPKYLITYPDTFILDHLPSHAWWQLTDKVLPEKTFEKDSSDIHLFIASKKGETNSCEANISVYEYFTHPYKPLFKAKKGHQYNTQNYLILSYGKEASAMYWFRETIKTNYDYRKRIKINDSCSVLLKEAAKDLNAYNAYTQKERALRIKKNIAYNNKALQFSNKLISSNLEKIDKLKSVDETINKEIKKLNKEKTALHKEIQALRNKDPNYAKKPMVIDSLLTITIDSLKHSTDSLSEIKFHKQLELIGKNISSMDSNAIQISKVSADIKALFKVKKKLRLHFHWRFQPEIDTLQNQQNKFLLSKDSLWQLNNDQFSRISSLIKNNNSNYKKVSACCKNLIIIANKCANPDLFKSTTTSWIKYDKQRLEEIDSCIQVYKKEKEQIGKIHKKIKKAFKKENKANRKELKAEKYRFKDCNWFYNKLCKYYLKQSKRFSKRLISENEWIQWDIENCKKQIKKEEQRIKKEKKEREKEEKRQAKKNKEKE